jgi:hypothetical protein
MKKVTATPSDDDDDGDSEEVDAPRRSTRSKKQGAPPSLHPSRMPSSADSQSLLAHYGRGRQVNRQVEGRQRCTRSRQLRGKSKIKAAARDVVVDSATSSDESSTSMATSTTDEAPSKTAKTTQAIEGADGKVCFSPPLQGLLAGGPSLKEARPEPSTPIGESFRQSSRSNTFRSSSGTWSFPSTRASTYVPRRPVSA